MTLLTSTTSEATEISAKVESEVEGMIRMDQYGYIRTAHRVYKKSINPHYSRKVLKRGKDICYYLGHKIVLITKTEISKDAPYGLSEWEPFNGLSNKMLLSPNKQLRSKDVL